MNCIRHFQNVKLIKKKITFSLCLESKITANQNVINRTTLRIVFDEQLSVVGYS